MLVGQRLHISHDHHLIRSWGIRHEKQFDIDEVLYQDCVKKLLYSAKILRLSTRELMHRYQARKGDSSLPMPPELCRKLLLHR